MMKKILLILLFLTTPAFAAEKESVYDRVMRTGTIRCGYTVTEAVQKDPNTGKIHGLVPEIVEEAARVLDLKEEWVEEFTWANFTEVLRSGRGDALCINLWGDAVGAKFMLYSVPFHFSGVGAFVRADDTRFDGSGFEKLNSPDVRVSTMDGEMSGIIAAQDFPKAKPVSITQLGDSSQLLLELTHNKADV